VSSSGNATTFEELLDVRALPEVKGAWTGPPASATRARAFGGHALAQAVMASAATVPDTHVLCSVHASFVRPSAAELPSRYTVSELRDGSTFGFREVAASQGDQPLTMATIAWQAAGFDDSERGQIRSLPELPPSQTLPYPAPGVLTDELDLRWLDVPGGRGLWFRTRNPIGERPTVHAAVALYVSDLWLLDTLFRSVGLRFGDRSVRSGSLDHSAWFHRPIHTGNWCYLESTAVSVTGGTGLVQAALYDSDGYRLATFAQQAAMLPRT
jgi:acyl-CoA thioesterase-2